MRTGRYLSPGAAAATILLSGCAMIQHRAEVSPVDQQFMLLAASVGIAEADLGKLAMERGSTDAVRAYGEHMVHDHSRVNEELFQLADRKNVVLLKAMDPADHTLYSELKKLSGPEFDRQYMLAQLNIHRMGNALYASEAENGQDSDVRDFASRNTPVGIEHLKRARTLQE